MASRLLPHERVSRCGAIPHGAYAEIRVKEGRAHFAGVETCGSVWACPVCAAKVSEVRRQEVETAITRHVEAGGAVYMMAFTVPHHRFQVASVLREGVADIWRKVVSGAPWMRAKVRAGVVHTIRALEVTYGENGWHPHLHVLFLTSSRLSKPAVDDLEGFLFDRWSRFAEKKGFGDCYAGVFHLEECAAPAAAGEYVAKWGADAELTKGHLKTGRMGGRTPWELLDAADRGDRQAAVLFREYVTAFKGARQLTWSLGAKKALGIDEREDEEIAAVDVVADTIGMVPKRVFRRVVKARALSAVLEIAEAGGWKAVDAHLRERGWIDHEDDEALARASGVLRDGFHVREGVDS